MKEDTASYDEKMKKYLGLRGAGIIAALDGIDPPEPEEDEEDEVVDYIEAGSEREKESIEFAKNTLRNMYIAFLIVSAIFLLAGSIIFRDRLKFALGILTGTATGLYYIQSLNRSVREVLNFDDKSAEKAMKRDGRIRLIVIGLGAAAVSIIVGGSAVYGVLAQIFSIKLSAYGAGLLLKLFRQT